MQCSHLVFAILKSLTPPGFEVTFFDDRIEEIDYEHPTDLVAISVGTFTARQSYKIAAIYREKGTPVVMGGYHATLLPQEVKQHADAVVVGSAENIWYPAAGRFCEQLPEALLPIGREQPGIFRNVLRLFHF
jgi:radical SAM superfamily enzyme YgiQ (UPF0313 family)